MVKAIEQRGARDIAKRALETTGQAFRFAIAHGYTRRNPAAQSRSRLASSQSHASPAQRRGFPLPLRRGDARVFLRQIEVVCIGILEPGLVSRLPGQPEKEAL